MIYVMCGRGGFKETWNTNGNWLYIDDSHNFFTVFLQLKT